MVEELLWDSNLLQKKLGVIKGVPGSLHEISELISRARRDGFRYLICRLDRQETSVIRNLESCGFYLADVGVTLCREPGSSAAQRDPGRQASAWTVSVADSRDIPVLRAMARGLFAESRFYSDPFYTTEEADLIFEQWVVNSVKGEAADVVLTVEDKGFISCGLSDGLAGKIILLGVAEGQRGCGVGGALVRGALKWFGDRGVSTVSVRTQLRNVRSVNFYVKQGFAFSAYDLMLAIML